MAPAVRAMEVLKETSLGSSALSVEVNGIVSPLTTTLAIPISSLAFPESVMLASVV